MNNDNELCSCGRDTWDEQYDFHGIYCGKMCDKCFKEKYKQHDYLPEGDDILGDDL